RLKERDEIDARKKARQAELKTRKEPEEKVYEITLKITDLPGLPAPLSKTNLVAKAKSDSEPHKNAEPKTDGADADNDDEEDIDSKAPPVDVNLKEAKRIPVDLISLWPGNTAVAKTSALSVTRGLE